MQHRKRQITLKQRMGLCLAAFFAAFAMQLTLNGYQSRAVQAVQDAQMGCFNAISRFQGGVESSISVLENYRWENSEPEVIIDRLQSASSTCNAWLWRIGTSLNSLESVSDEQWVLYSAVDTVYQTYTGLLDELENDLLSGNDAAASQLYYAKVVPCGDYLSQYTLQLLETAIQDSQTTYTTISALNERITMLQTVVVALCVALEVPWGYLADRLGYRRTMVLCCGLYFISKLVFWQADSFGDFLTERILLAVVQAGLSGVDSAILYLSCKGRDSLRVFSVYNALTMAGLVAAGGVFALLPAGSHRLAALLTAGSYALALLFALGLREVRSPEPAPARGSFAAAAREALAFCRCWRGPRCWRKSARWPRCF